MRTWSGVVMNTIIIEFWAVIIDPWCVVMLDQDWKPCCGWYKWAFLEKLLDHWSINLDCFFPILYQVLDMNWNQDIVGFFSYFRIIERKLLSTSCFFFLNVDMCLSRERFVMHLFYLCTQYIVKLKLIYVHYRLAWISSLFLLDVDGGYWYCICALIWSVKSSLNILSFCWMWSGNILDLFRVSSFHICEVMMRSKENQFYPPLIVAADFICL